MRDNISIRVNPSQYVKPALSFEGYEWKWSDHSFGLKEGEVKEFKHFIKSLIPILSDHLRYIKVLEDITEKKKHLDKHQLAMNAFSPFINLKKTSHKTGVSFSLEFTWDDQIFVDRVEDVVGNPISLKWELGQLFEKTS